MPKSVLHLRIDSPGYNSDSIERAFREVGFEYHSLIWQNYRYDNGVELLREKVIAMASEIKPTIIFAHIQNNEAFDLTTWEELAKHGFVINYTLDARLATEMEWMYDIAPHIGFTFFACQEDVWNCNLRGVTNIGHSHSSCDMELFKPKIPKPTNYAFDIVFCGNKYTKTNLNFPLAEERQEMIALLQEKYGSKFAAFGLGQKNGMIRPEVEANVYNYSKIAISQNNFMLHDYTSDRLFRIMASGTMCLTKFFPGIHKIFEKEIHLDYWNNFDDLTKMIDYYLSDDKERESVAAMGCQLVRENHRWQDRIADMEKIIAPILKSY
jgi:hypothetical protein